MNRKDVQEVMQKYVGIVRTKDELLKGLEELERLKTEASLVKVHASSQYNPGWNEAIDLRNLLITAEAVTRAAAMREESRGAHTRLDFEGERNEWLNYNVIIQKSSDGGMNALKIKREDPPKELAQIAYATLEDLEG